MSARARAAAVVAAGLVPWVVVLGPGPGARVSLVFSFGLVNPSPLHLTTLPAYLLVLTRGLPASLLAWPVGTLLWLAALGSALGAIAIGREDGRLSGGLLVLAGFSLLSVAGAVGRPAGVLALPVGTAALWAVAWWGYGPALRRLPLGGRGRER